MWGGCRSPSFSSLSPFPFPVIAPPILCPRFFSSLLKVSKVWGSSSKFSTVPSEKWRPVAKVGWEPNTLGPHDLQSWRGRVPPVPQGGCTYDLPVSLILPHAANYPGCLLRPHNILGRRYSEEPHCPRSSEPSEHLTAGVTDKCIGVSAAIGVHNTGNQRHP